MMNSNLDLIPESKNITYGETYALWVIQRELEQEFGIDVSRTTLAANLSIKGYEFSNERYDMTTCVFINWSKIKERGGK